MSRSLTGVLVALLLVGVACPLSAAEADPDRADLDSIFMRRTLDKQGAPQSLETAIVRFAPAEPGQKWPVVDLIGAVHVGESQYYERLNREFAKYDAVLYELVAPEGTRIPKGAEPRAGNPLSAMQMGMTEMLELTFQLEGIDYSAKNLVHADMSPEEFSRSMKDRGESFLSMFAKMMGYAMAKQAGDPNGSGDLDMLFAFFSKNRALALKRVMSEQFEDMEGTMEVLGGPDGSTLISERNKAALEVLRGEIDGGKRRLAIFYGAGHMPDMAKRLREDFKLKPVSVRWLEAWNLREEPAATDAPAPSKPKEKHKKAPVGEWI